MNSTPDLTTTKWQSLSEKRSMALFCLVFSLLPISFFLYTTVYPSVIDWPQVQANVVSHKFLGRNFRTTVEYKVKEKTQLKVYSGILFDGYFFDKTKPVNLKYNPEAPKESMVVSGITVDSFIALATASLFIYLSIVLAFDKNPKSVRLGT